MKNQSLIGTIKILAFLFLLIHGAGALAQRNISISGLVLDKETKKPLAHSTLNISRKAIGTVTNKAGEFNFTIPKAFINDSLVVSMIGYATELRSIKSLVNPKALVFELEPQPIVLDEIVINHKPLTPTEIIKKAISRIKFNYPQDPYMLEAFYRHFQIENGKGVGLLEAAINIFDKGYQSAKIKFSSRERVVLKEVRKSLDMGFKADVYKKTNLIFELLMVNDVRYLTNALDLRRTKYELEKYTTLDDQLVYVVKTSGPWTHYVYIDMESFAILKVELDAKWDGEEQNEWTMNDSIKCRSVYIKKTLNFKKHEGLYYPIFSNYSWRLEGINTKSGKKVFTSDFYQEILANDVITKDIIKPDKKELMDIGMSLEFLSKPYNEAFWKNYNIIKQNPPDAKLIKDLERDVSLEEQFKKSN